MDSGGFGEIAVSVLRPLEAVLSVWMPFGGSHTRYPVDMSFSKKALVRGYKNVEQVFGLWTTYPQGVDNFVRLCSEHLFARGPLTIASERPFPRTNVRDRILVRVVGIPHQLRGQCERLFARPRMHESDFVYPRTPEHLFALRLLTTDLVVNGERTFG